MFELPYTLNDLRTLVKRGEGKIKFEIFGLEPLIDTVFFFIALVIGIWLLISIARRGTIK